MQPLEVFYKKGFPKNFAKFTGKHLRQGLLIQKETLAKVFSCEFCKFFNNTLLTEHLHMTTSARGIEKDRWHEMDYSLTQSSFRF